MPSYATNHFRNLRKEAVQTLGAKCVMCGFADERALQIDHINGDGAKERKKRTYKGNFHQHVKKSFLAGDNKYQLLCANCNWIKRAENNECRIAKKISPECRLCKKQLSGYVFKTLLCSKCFTNGQATTAAMLRKPKSAPRIALSYLLNRYTYCKSCMRVLDTETEVVGTGRTCQKCSSQCAIIKL